VKSLIFILVCTAIFIVYNISTNQISKIEDNFRNQE
jgi:hypothetical protein